MRKKGKYKIKINASRNIVRSGLCIVLVLCMIFSLVGASGVFAAQNSFSDADRIQDSLAAINVKKQQLQDELDNLRAEEASAQEELAIISSQITLTAQDYAYQKQLVSLQAEKVEQYRARLDIAQEKEAEEYEKLKMTLRALEEAPRYSFWQVFFSSNHIGEIFSRISLTKEVVDYGKQQISKLESSRTVLADIRYQLQKEESQYIQNLHDLEQKQVELDQKNKELVAKVQSMTEKEQKLVAELELYQPKINVNSSSYKMTTPLTDSEIIDLLTLASDELTAAGISEDEIQIRLSTLQAGLSLVGKVDYFWGGRSFSPGWNSQWGTLKPIQHAGCDVYPLGELFSYGLDCSGFVFWSALTAYGTDSWTSPMEWMAGLNSTGIYNATEHVAWKEKLPADAVVNNPITHIGYYLCTTKNGEELFLHCMGSHGPVVTTNLARDFDRAMKIF